MYHLQRCLGFRQYASSVLPPSTPPHQGCPVPPSGVQRGRLPSFDLLPLDRRADLQPLRVFVGGAGREGSGGDEVHGGGEPDGNGPPDQGRRKYELVATIMHHGQDPSKGHYTADVRSSGGQWLRYDDSAVIPVGTNKVLHDHAYVLFYKQV